MGRFALCEAFPQRTIPPSYPSGDPLLSLTNAHAKRGPYRHKLLPMTSKHTVLDREIFVQALRHMGEQDLLFLNRLVVGMRPVNPY